VDLPSHHIAVVGIGDFAAPARGAIAYARAAHPDALHMVHVEIDPEHAAGVRRETAEAGIQVEVLPSPYRSLTEPLIEYVGQLRDAQPPGTMVTVFIPEFIVPGILGKVLHNQSALALKSALLLEPDVAVASVPWHLIPESEYGDRREYTGVSVSASASSTAGRVP
jgi:hypothetical protein